MDVDGCLSSTSLRFRGYAPGGVSAAFWRVQLYVTIGTWQLRMRYWSWSPAKWYAGFLAEAFVGLDGTDNATVTSEHHAGSHGSRCPPYHSFAPEFSMKGDVGFAIQALEDLLDLCYYVYGIGHREILPISRVCRRECRNKPLEWLRSDGATPDR